MRNISSIHLSYLGTLLRIMKHPCSFEVQMMKWVVFYNVPKFLSFPRLKGSMALDQEILSDYSDTCWCIKYDISFDLLISSLRY